MDVFGLCFVACRVAGLASDDGERVAYIKKVKGEYCVKSEKNPGWSGGCYKSKEKAQKRLKQVEMFKHMK